MNGIILATLKYNLDILTDSRDEYLSYLLDVSAEEIAGMGITINEDARRDQDLLVRYAAWLYRSRADTTGEPMPRMLRYALNNRKIRARTGGEEANDKI